MESTWIMLLAVAVLFSTPVQGGTLYRHSLRAYPGAVCIDGSAAEYYTSFPPADASFSSADSPFPSADSSLPSVDVDGTQRWNKKEGMSDRQVGTNGAESGDVSHRWNANGADNPEGQNLPDAFAAAPKRRNGIGADRSESGAFQAKNYVIFLEGGGYCHEAGACKWRCGVAPWLCTANGPLTKSGTGILSDDPTDNPSFHDYFKIDVPYCTGDMYIGRREGSEVTLDQHFKGRVVLDAMIMDLKKTTGIGRAINVVLSGSSAGGAGVAFNCNYLQGLLPHAEIWCIVDAAFYYPIPGPMHNVSACDSIDRVLSLGAELWEAPEVAGFDLHGPWWREIGPHLLIGTARYDRFGLETYCANLSSTLDMAEWEAGIVEKTQALQEQDPQVSFFMPACLAHMMLRERRLYSQLQVGAYGLSYSDALWWWINGRGAVHVWDACPRESADLFCNPQC